MGLNFDSSGNLFSATSGTVKNQRFRGQFSFELAPGLNGWSLSVLHEFSGQGPTGDRLAMDSAGNLFGATATGGSWGSLYELANDAGAFRYSTLFTFCNDYPTCPNGIYPNGVSVDSSGNLYGTAEGGGASGYGDVFMLPAVQRAQSP
jgi:uncharacterized repeat protein (TIGR03803 family)